jgi:hypothetical protein
LAWRRLDVYLVLDDFGRPGPAGRETDDTQADRGTLMRHLLEGQFENPVRIVPFNPAEGWSRDVADKHCRRASKPMCSARRSAVELAGLS